MAVKITQRIPTVEYGYLEIEADNFGEFIQAYVETSDHLSGSGGADPVMNQAISTLQQGGLVGVNPGLTQGGQVGQWQQPQQAPVQQAAPPVQSGPVAPNCAHGQMVYRESKPGAPKSWRGFFCPTPKGTPNQCGAQWL